MADKQHLWTAQRHGQDWRDESTFAALDWLIPLVSSAAWLERENAVDQHFQTAKARWAAGERVPLFRPEDKIGWYVHQARRYADPASRTDFFIPEGYRIAPIFRRLGDLVPVLRLIDGAEDRARRLMRENTSEPDDGIFELLVAAAYAVRGWKVKFVPETPGKGKQPDLLVDRGRKNWAVECKRAGRHGYALDERAAGERIASRAHARSKAAGRPVAISVSFEEELHEVNVDYLVPQVERFLREARPVHWVDRSGRGMVMDADISSLHAVMARDDLHFGSSRMVQLLCGGYHPDLDFTIEGDWKPASGRPFHATWVSHASLVAWRSVSAEAARRKSMHFRGLVGRASEQLPGDRPGAIHVGYEALGGNSADGLRHHYNREQMRTFDPQETGLRVVYGNYFRNELVTERNESAAVSETTAWYPVGRKRLFEPLPKHLLFSDDSGIAGSHL